MYEVLDKSTIKSEFLSHLFWPNVDILDKWTGGSYSMYSLQVGN